MKGTIENFVAAGQAAQAAVDEAVAEATEDTADALFCTICQDPIPEGRATRQTATCSEKCKNKLDTIRANQRKARKCPYCLHPATPEEREEFRLWRQNRGDRKVAFEPRERTGATKHQLRDALKAATRHLSRFDDLLGHLIATPALEGFLGHFPRGLKSREDLTNRLERVRLGVREINELVDNRPNSNKLSA